MCKNSFEGKQTTIIQALSLVSLISIIHFMNPKRKTKWQPIIRNKNQRVIAFESLLYLFVKRVES